jgi:hypothetical protein
MSAGGSPTTLVSSDSVACGSLACAMSCWRRWINGPAEIVLGAFWPQPSPTEGRATLQYFDWTLLWVGRDHGLRKIPTRPAISMAASAQPARV